MKPIKEEQNWIICQQNMEELGERMEASLPASGLFLLELHCDSRVGETRQVPNRKVGLLDFLLYASYFELFFFRLCLSTLKMEWFWHNGFSPS